MKRFFRIVAMGLYVSLVVGLAGCAGRGITNSPASVSGAGVSEPAAAPSSSAPASAADSAAAEKEYETLRLNFAAIIPPTANLGIRELEAWTIPEINRRLAERTNYQIEFNMMYGSAVAAGDEVTSLKDNVVDISTIVYPYEAAKMPLHNIFYWFPFCSPDPEVAMKTMNKLAEEFPIMNSMMEEDYNIIMLTSSGMQLCFNMFTKFEVKQVSDLRGHKIGAGGANLAAVTAGGATPVQSVGSEAYTSIQTGVYEGWINDIDSVTRSKLYEVAPYFVKTRFGVVCNSSYAISKAAADKLPPEVLEILKETFLDGTAHAAEIFKEEEAQCEANWVAGGGTVIDFSDDQIAIWSEQLKDLPVQKAKEADALGYPGTEMAKRFYELQAEYGHEWQYTPVFE